MNPKISIIIPIYNSGIYLKKCLDSLIKQSYYDFETILVNDGSKDNSLEICNEYKNKFKSCTIIDQDNLGIDKARNAGLMNCKGAYITFIDSDDTVDPDWLLTFISKIEEHPNCDLIVQGIIVDYQNRISYARTNDYYGEKDQVIDAYIALKRKFLNGFIFNKLYKREIINKNKLKFEFTLKEDLLFNLRYINCIESICVTSLSYYHYIQRGPKSLIHKRYAVPYMEKLITALKNSGLVLSRRFNSKLLERFTYEEYLLSYSVLLISMYRKNSKIAAKKERIEYIKKYQEIFKSIKIRTFHNTNFKKKMIANFELLPPKLVDISLNITTSFYYTFHQ